MPVSIEHLIIYGIVFLVLLFLARRLTCSLLRSGKSIPDCSC